MKPCSTLLANDATMVIRNECFLEIVMWQSADGRAKEFMFIVNCHRSVARRPKGYEIWWGCAHRENMMRPMLLPYFVNRDIRSGDIVRWLRKPPQLLLFTSTHTNQRKNKIVKKYSFRPPRLGADLVMPGVQGICSMSFIIAALKINHVDGLNLGCLVYDAELLVVLIHNRVAPG